MMSTLLTRQFYALLVVVQLPLAAGAWTLDRPSKAWLQKHPGVEQLITQKDYAKALTALSETANTQVRQSAQGIGISSLLLIKNNLTYLGLTQLFQQASAAKMSPGLKAQIRASISNSDPVWQAIDLNNNAYLIFPDLKKSVVQKATAINITAKKDLLLAQKIIKSIPKKSNASIWYQWQSALYLSLNNQNTEAIKIYQRLLSLGQNFISDDELHLAIARTYYQMGNLDEASVYYHKIDKSSIFWFEAIEETSWAAHRQKDYAYALSQSKSLINTTFAPLIGSETFYLHALSQLKICEYKGVFKTMDLYKTAHKNRMTNMSKYVINNSPEYIALIDSQWDSSLDVSKTGLNPRHLPRWFDRNDSVQMLVSRLKYIQSELDQANRILNLTAYSHALVNELTQQKNQARLGLLSTTRLMAQNELAEIKRTTQGMHLIEAEITQRMHVIGQSKKIQKFEAKDPDDLVFPDDENDIWLDEIGSYQVKAGNCDQMTSKGAKL